MLTKVQLLRGAALGVALAGGVGVTAQAASLKHRHQVAAPSPLAAEVKALKAEVQTLEARLDAQAAAQQQAAAQAQQVAQSAQATAQAAAQADQLAISRIPADVNTAVAALPKPKPGWEAGTTVGGLIYYDLSNIEQKSDGVRTAPSGPGVDIKRAYIAIDHKFNDVYSVDLTTDAQYSSAIGATEFFVKKAYVQASYSPMLTVRVGGAAMPWIPFVEDVYGYRYVEQTLIDRTKFGASNDWGAHVLGKFLDGRIGYQLSLVNGAGFKVPGTASRSKGLDLEGRVNANFGPMVLAVGGYTGKLAKDVVGGPAVFHTAQRVDALVAYVTPKIHAGVEYFDATNWTSVTSIAADKSEGLSGFAAYNITDRIGVFGRYDWVKPNGRTAPGKKDNYFNVGVSYEPTKTLDFSLAYKRDSVDNGILSTGNGAIGGIHKGTYDEVGLFSQAKW